MNTRSDSQVWGRFQCKIRILPQANWNVVSANWDCAAQRSARMWTRTLTLDESIL